MQGITYETHSTCLIDLDTWNAEGNRNNLLSFHMYSLVYSCVDAPGCLAPDYILTFDCLPGIIVIWRQAIS